MEKNGSVYNYLALMSSWLSSSLGYYLDSAQGVSSRRGYQAISYLYASEAPMESTQSSSNRWYSTPNSSRLKNGQRKGTAKRPKGYLYPRKFPNGDECRPLKGTLVPEKELSQRLISQFQQAALKTISTDEKSCFLLHLFYKL